MAKRKKPTRAKNQEAQEPIEPVAAEAAGDTAMASETAGGTEADVWAEDRVGEVETGCPRTEESATDGAVWAESAAGEEAPVGEKTPASEETPAGGETPACGETPEGGEAPAGGETPEGEVPLAGDETAEEVPVVLDASQMESIIESLLFASDKVLGLTELKRLLGERDGKKVTAAVDALLERRKGSGIEVVRLANGWHLRTNPEHARWVSKLLAGRPMRLSRAMMETLAIVAYRQPVTRPEVDDIRGVDCGPVLKTLLDRGLIRIIGKKEEVGRPLLYGTTPEFLRVFSLGELGDLPTLREYAELSSEQQARVDAEHGPASGAASPQAAGGSAGAEAAASSTTAAYNLNFVPRSQLPDEPEENDPLLDELESATKVASKILGTVNEPAAEAAPEPEPEPATPPREPPSGS
jgi:segregation and condensation protein B